MEEEGTRETYITIRVGGVDKLLGLCSIIGFMGLLLYFICIDCHVIDCHVIACHQVISWDSQEHTVANIDSSTKEYYNTRGIKQYREPYDGVTCNDARGTNYRDSLNITFWFIDGGYISIVLEQ